MCCVCSYICVFLCGMYVYVYMPTYVVMYPHVRTCMAIEVYIYINCVFKFLPPTEFWNDQRFYRVLSLKQTCKYNHLNVNSETTPFLCL